MLRRVSILLRARLQAAREGAAPVAVLLLHGLVAAVLCGLVRDLVPPYAYAVVALSISAALVSVPLLGELSDLLVSDEGGEWTRALPVRPVELHVARTLHLLLALGVLSLGSLVPAAVLAPSDVGVLGRAALVASGLGQSLAIAAVLLWMHSLFGARAQPVLLLVQTALFVLVLVGSSIGLRYVPALREIAAPWTAEAFALELYPPAWFAAPLAAGAGPAPPFWRWVAPVATIAAALSVALLSPPAALAARRGAPLLGRLLTPVRRLATLVWVGRSERPSFDLVYDGLPKEREFVIRTYPLVAVPLAFLFVGARGEGGESRDALLALLLFTPGVYLPILLAHLAGSHSAPARWILQTAPVPLLSHHNGALKAVVVRFVVPLYGLLALVAWSQGGAGLALRLVPPAFLVATLLTRVSYSVVVRDLPMSKLPSEMMVNLDWLGILGGFAVGLTLLAVLAVEWLDGAVATLAVTATLIAFEIVMDGRWRRRALAGVPSGQPIGTSTDD